MFFFLLHEVGVVQRQPDIDLPVRRIRIQRSRKDVGVGRDTHKSEQHDSGQAHGLVTIEGLLPPSEDRRVVNGIFIDDIEEDVEVDELHLRSFIFLTISSSSSAAASASALSSLTLGTPMAWVCSR